MQGHFNIKLLNAGDYTDGDFLKAKDNGTINQMLGGLSVCQNVEQDNVVFDNFAGYTFYWCFSGGGITVPFGLTYGSGKAYLASILLVSDNGEPAYTEQHTHLNSSYYNPVDDGNKYVSMHNLTNTVDSFSGGKRFISDDIQAHEIFTDINGKESINFVSRFLYLTSQGNSNNIRGLRVWFNEEGDQADRNEDRASAARIRFKDANNNPIIINKTSAEVLLIEYTFTLITI